MSANNSVCTRTWIAPPRIDPHPHGNVFVPTSNCQLIRVKRYGRWSAADNSSPQWNRKMVRHFSGTTCATFSFLEVTVRDLQATLFPPTPKSGFFSNFYIKTNFEEDLDEVKREVPAREIFSLTRESNFVPQAPRWPTECQVLEEKIKHISYIPPTPEPYYTPSGKEPQPKPTGDEFGIIVYQYTPISAVNYVSDRRTVNAIFRFSSVGQVSEEAGTCYRHAFVPKKTL